MLSTESSAQPGAGVTHHMIEERTIAVIPAFNEERFIGSIVLKTCLYVDEVLVVDDGSDDATADVAQAAGARVIRHAENQGKGGALNTGFRVARERGASYVVTLDADGQHEPAQLATVLAPVLDGQADLVIGSRYIEDDSDVPFARVWGHKFFNFVTNQASGVKTSDSQSGYRAFSRCALDSIVFSSKSFSVESEMQFLANQYGLKVCEVPIVIRYDDKPKRPVIQHGMIVLNGILRLTGQYRPLFFFGLPGLILLILGLFWGFWVVNIYQATQELAVGYTVLSALLTMSGMIALSTGVTLHSVRGLLQDYFSLMRGTGSVLDSDS